MSYDTTGPVRVNETKSLLLLILLVVLVAGGIWASLYLNRSAAPGATTAAATVPAALPLPSPPPTAPSPAAARQRPAAAPALTPSSRTRGPRRGNPAARPPDPRGDFIRWPSDNVADAQGVTTLKSGSVYLNISLVVRNNRRIVEVWRGYASPEPRPRTFSTAHFVQHVLNDPRTAERYDVTPEQVAQLKALELKLPGLTQDQQSAMTELFLAAEAARRDTKTPPKPPRPATTSTAPASQPDPQKRAADAQAALMQAAAKLVIPPTELDELAEDAAEAREIFRPDQLDLIDSDFDRMQSGFDRPGYPRRNR